MCLVAYKKGVYRCLSLKVAHKIDCQNGFNFNKIHFDQLNHYFIDILFMRDAGGLASPPWLTHIINYISYFYTEHFLVKLKYTLKKLLWCFCFWSLVAFLWHCTYLSTLVYSIACFIRSCQFHVNRSMRLSDWGKIINYTSNTYSRCETPPNSVFIQILTLCGFKLIYCRLK